MRGTAGARLVLRGRTERHSFAAAAHAREPRDREGKVYYYMALTILLLIYVGLRWLTRSQFGLVLAGIRLQESRMAFFGYRVQNYKGVVFALAGTIAGLSGGLYAFHEGYVGPGQLGPVLSTQVVLYVLFGGVGTLVGAVVGVGLIDLFSYLLSQQWETGWPIVLGLLLLAVILFRPTGLIGFLVSQRERIGSFGGRAAAREEKAGRQHKRGTGAMTEMAAASILLEVRGLKKIYATLTALGGVDLTVTGNSFHGLIGPNGSGKTTLLKCIAGAEAPTAGAVTFLGQDITNAAPAERSRAGMSLKFQITSVLPEPACLRQCAARAAGAGDAMLALAFSRSRAALHQRALEMLAPVRPRQPAATSWRDRCRMGSSNGSRSPWRCRAQPRAAPARRANRRDEPAGTPRHRRSCWPRFERAVRCSSSSTTWISSRTSATRADGAGSRAGRGQRRDPDGPEQRQGQEAYLAHA
mgnify:CR=1 FL=1